MRIHPFSIEPPVLGRVIGFIAGFVYEISRYFWSFQRWTKTAAAASGIRQSPLFERTSQLWGWSKGGEGNDAAACIWKIETKCSAAGFLTLNVTLVHGTMLNSLWCRLTRVGTTDMFHKIKWQGYHPIITQSLQLVFDGAEMGKNRRRSHDLSCVQQTRIEFGQIKGLQTFKTLQIKSVIYIHVWNLFYGVCNRLPKFWWGHRRLLSVADYIFRTHKKRRSDWKPWQRR